jgi:DNA-binding GntR family transcriptional regulator
MLGRLNRIAKLCDPICWPRATGLRIILYLHDYNNGSTMTTTPSPADSASDQSKSDRVYDFLRRRIRELEIPPGTALRKNEIALECAVSRAPVSEAIARLASEGLVDVFAQDGSYVSPIRPQDIRETLFIRTALEVEAVKKATRQADQHMLEKLEENVQAQARALREDKLDLAGFDDLDEMFHATIIAAIHSPRTEHLLDAARALLDRPRFLALPERHRPEDTFNEHSRILDAIRTGDPELAGAAMRVHLNRVSDAIEIKLAQIVADDDD